MVVTPEISAYQLQNNWKFESKPHIPRKRERGCGGKHRRINMIVITQCNQKDRILRIRLQEQSQLGLFYHVPFHNVPNSDGHLPLTSAVI